MAILETDVICELLRPDPDRHVLDWLSGLDGTSVFLTAITESELRLSVACQPKEQDPLPMLLDQIIAQDFSNRVRPFDGKAAKACAMIAATCPTLSMANCQVAAIARTHSTTVVTGKPAELAACGVPLIDPWTA